MNGRLHLQGCIIDLGQRRIERTGDQLRLTEREAALMDFLAARPGQDVPRATLLTEVWGYTASVNSRTIDTTVRRLRQKIERDPLNPEHLLTAYGVGYRLELHRAEPVAEQTLPSLPGRESEIAEGMAALADDGLLTVIGPPGVGKSRLAEALAEGCGRVVIRAAPDTTLHAAMAAALSLDPAAVDLSGRIDAALADRPGALLLIDPLNPGPADAADLARWHRSVSGLAVLAVTTERLRITGEHTLTLAGLSEADGLAMLAGADDDTEQLRQIVARVDGLPLALELIAAQLRLLSAEALLQRLDERLELLVHGRRDAPGHHLSLRQAIAGAWSTLPDVLQAVLAQCAIFPGSFTPAAAEAILRSPDRQPVTTHLLSLLDRALLRRSGDRLTVEANVRLFAARHATDPGLRKRFDAWCLVQAAPLRGWWAHDMPERIAALLPEHGNLQQLARHALDSGDVLEAALSLHPVFEVHGPAALHDALLAAAVAGEAPTRLHIAYARRLRRLGKIDAAAAHLTARMAAAPSEETAAITAAHLGILRHHQGEPAQAAACIEEACRRAPVGSRAEGQARAAAGVLALRAGSHAAAEDHLTRASARLRATGDHAAAIIATLNLARARLGAGDVDAALDAIAEAEADDARLLGRQRGLLQICAGHAELADGAYEDAEARYAEAEAHYRRSGQPRDALLVALFRGWVALEQGAPDASRLHRTLLNRARQGGHTHLVPLARTQLACARWQGEQPAAAARLLLQAADTYDHLRADRLARYARLQAAAAQAAAGMTAAAQATLAAATDLDPTAARLADIAAAHIAPDPGVLARLSADPLVATTPTLRLARHRLLQAVTSKTMTTDGG